MARPGTPFRKAADARRTTPGPQSTRYGVLLTTIATAGPARTGSAAGLPVPSITTWVRDGAAGGVGVCAKSAEPQHRKIATAFTRYDRADRRRAYGTNVPPDVRSAGRVTKEESSGRRQFPAGSSNRARKQSRAQHTSRWSRQLSVR